MITLIPQRDRIEDKMIKVAVMIGERNRENKGMLFKTLGGVIVFFLAVSGGVSALLSSNTHLLNGNDYLDDTDDDIIDK